MFALMRKHAPVYHNDERGFWALSRHRDVEAALLDFRRFSSADGITLGPKQQDGAEMIIMMDPPRHDELRRLISRAFTPRRIAVLETSVRAMCRRLLDEADSVTQINFVEMYCNVVPMAVITHVLGVPDADRKNYQQWIDTFLFRAPGRDTVTPEGLAAASHAFEALASLIAQRRMNPGDDIVSALIAAEENEQRLTDNELLQFTFLLLIAGYETSTKLIGNAAYLLWRHPDQRRLLAADPTMLPSAVEEVLRFDSPTPYMARTLTKDVTIDGVTMPKGDKVALLLGSANRDAEVFPEPDRFDITRPPGRHLAFGRGVLPA
ncbi:cytochrome P450 [Mycobacterium branderi]|uniref:cytochrome P450 n=1 Tax=Mycobacterium branderi TaxID=43348 RepID=UPI0013D8137D|nr:cytochrome P450 [Mycobacterium branderi]MCV7231710.1 cytochrome P450 [Mycobacterium branderi]